MRRQNRTLVALLVLVCACSTLLGVGAASAAPTAEPPLVATPQGPCGEGSNPETGIQGRVPKADQDSGRAAEGYSCNAERIGNISDTVPVGTEGGFKVERYVDAAGRECAYYDTTLLAGTDVLDVLDFDSEIELDSLIPSLLADKVGVNVVDMTDPTAPTVTTSLITPAMLSPHESLLVNQERGLLAATLGNPAFNLGILDVYDISQDCRNPVLRSSSPAGILGHESGWSPDGLTFYSASPGTQTLVAVDLTNPALPEVLTIYQVPSHGLSISADGNRAYVAGLDGLVILDVSEVQSRQANPVIREVSTLDWESRSIPQNAIPITIDDHPYLVEIDEFGSGSAVGAARIIDIADDEAPTVLSNLRLAVHQPENFAAQADDIGNQSPIQGYAGHYCNVPTRVDPQIVACSMIMSGLRVFSIVDPANPVEIAYYNSPSENIESFGGNYAMSSPSFVPERNEIWYSDGFTGFHVVRLTNGTFSGQAATPVQQATTTAAPAATAVPGTVAAAPSTPGAGPSRTTLPATGSENSRLFLIIAVLSGLGAAGLVLRRTE